MLHAVKRFGIFDIVGPFASFLRTKPRYISANGTYQTFKIEKLNRRCGLVLVGEVRYESKRHHFNKFLAALKRKEQKKDVSHYAALHKQALEWLDIFPACTPDTYLLALLCGIDGEFRNIVSAGKRHYA